MQNKPKFFQPSTLLTFIIKFLILGGLCFFLWTAISKEKNQIISLGTYASNLASELNFKKFIFVLCLAPINLFFEMNKWKVLVVENEKNISQKEVIFSVLTGFVFSYLIPFGLGDLFGRSFHADFSIMKNRIKSSLMAGGIQFLVALTAGVMALLKLKSLFVLPFWLICVFNASVLSLFFAFVLFFYFKFSNIQINFTQNKFLKTSFHFFESIVQTSSQVLFKSFGFALIRYIIFTIQLVLMFQIVGIDLSISFLTLNTALIFFAKSVIPTINAIGDLGIRESSATFFLAFFGIGPSRVITATLILWIINVLFPIILGMILIIYKVFRLKFPSK